MTLRVKCEVTCDRCGVAAEASLTVSESREGPRSLSWHTDLPDGWDEGTRGYELHHECPACTRAEREV